MGVVVGLIVLMALAALPIVIVFVVGSLAIFIWSWGRIGRYFINFARWLGDWRNFVPLSVLGTLVTIVLLLLAFVFLPQARIVWIVLLVMHLVITLVCLVFVMIAWIVWLCQWFWPQYRRWLWSTFAWLFGRTQRPTQKRIRGPTVKSSKPTGAAPPEGPLAKRRSILGSFWAIMMGKPPKPPPVAKPVEGGTAARVQPATKQSPLRRSWFASFLALMLGKPSHPTKQKSAPIRFEETEQEASAPSDGVSLDAKTDAEVPPVPRSPTPKPKSKPGHKGSWLGFMSSAILGRPSGPAKPRTKPVKTQTTERVPLSSDSDSMDAAARTSSTTSVAQATPAPRGTSRPKRTKPSLFGGIGSTIVGGATFAFGSVFSGVGWSMHKIGEGIEWIRVRLNLD